MVISVYNSTEQQDYLQTYSIDGQMYEMSLCFPKEPDQPLGAIRFTLRTVKDGTVFWDNRNITCFKNATVTIDDKVFHINDKEDISSLYKYLTGIDYLELEKQYKIENVEQAINKDFQ